MFVTKFTDHFGYRQELSEPIDYCRTRIDDGERDVEALLAMAAQDAASTPLARDFVAETEKGLRNWLDFEVSRVSAEEKRKAAREAEKVETEPELVKAEPVETKVEPVPETAEPEEPSEPQPDGVPPWLPFTKLPGLLFADGGLCLKKAKPGRKAEVVQFENYLYTPKGETRKTQHHIARARISVDGKQKPFYPRFFYRSRLHAIEEWQRAGQPRIRLSDTEQAAVNRYAERLGAEVSTSKKKLVPTSRY